MDPLCGLSLHSLELGLSCLGSLAVSASEVKSSFRLTASPPPPPPPPPPALPVMCTSPTALAELACSPGTVEQKDSETLLMSISVDLASFKFAITSEKIIGLKKFLDKLEHFSSDLLWCSFQRSIPSQSNVSCVFHK